MAFREQRPPQKPRREGPAGSLVEVRDNNMGQAMRRLKKIMQTEGIFKEMRDRTYFEKPSIKRKKAKAAAKKRWAKERDKTTDL